MRAEAPFDFRDLFVFDLANNHQGSVAHGLAIIRATAEVARKHGVRAAMKFQFRDLESLIHAEHRHASDHAQVRRFMGTRLSLEDFDALLECVRAETMLAMCTPFDEASVEAIVQRNFQVIKIASSSARDWPLLEAVAQSGLPIVASTGGLSLTQVDDLVSFLDHRACDFALMHCVSLYPTPAESCHLNRIDLFRERYRARVIGWSTHEEPDETGAVQVAYGKGARMFERHVGIPTSGSPLNAYSSTPRQLGTWLDAWAHARRLCGETEKPGLAAEQNSLDSLRRGVYSVGDVASGATLKRSDVYFAMPYVQGQLHSGMWSDGIVTQRDFSADRPLMLDALSIPAEPEHQIIKQAIHEVKAMLNEARIILNTEFQVSFSHHHGVSQFRDVGVVIIDCINREYCKKILVQLAGQYHPLHYHKLKEETFQVLHGELQVTLDGRERTLRPGDTCLVLPGVWHGFSTKVGCVLEEVSTTHFVNDSVYRDQAINRFAPQERKTVVDHWGRFQIRSKPAEGTDNGAI